MSVWAVTVYYNPQRYSSRYRNFDHFRSRLNVPLLTVEWSPDGHFELQNSDSDILIHLSGGDLMWQKERLLNIAIQSLPNECDVVAWLDHDIVFRNDDWAGELEATLAHASVVQLFSRVAHLSSEGTPPPLFVRESIVSTWLQRGSEQLEEMICSIEPEASRETQCENESGERSRLAMRPSSGHAWAARRTLLEAHGLYDGCICGAGDMAIALAALGLPHFFPRLFPYNAAQREHYLKWAEPFAAEINGNVATLASDIDHLFHGLLSNRQYQHRMHWASTSGLDPVLDLKKNAQGLWIWSRNRKTREAWMNQYFQQRLEDDHSDPSAVEDRVDQASLIRLG